MYSHIRAHKLNDEKWWTELDKRLVKLDEVKSMVTMLAGYKTYIVAVLMGVLTVLKSLGQIDETTYNTLMALLGAGAVGTVAAKINRLGNKGY